MAKTSPKKRRKPRTETTVAPVGTEAENSRSSTIFLFAGLSILFLVSVMSLIGGFGPHVDKIASFQLRLFGPVPLFFLLAAYACFLCWFCFKRVFDPPREIGIPFGHWACGFLLLYVFFSVILAVTMPDTFKEARFNFEVASREYAGFIGLFLVKKAFPPIFGAETSGLLFCCGLGIIMTSFCFGLRPKHLIELAKNIQLGFQILFYKMDFARKIPEPTTFIKANDTGDFVAVKLGEIKPAKGSPFGKPEKQNLTLLKEPMRPIESEPLSEDPIERIHRLLASTDDPLEIRRLRDELAEYKRIKEENEWEDKKVGELKIEGLLAKQSEELKIESGEWRVESEEFKAESEETQENNSQLSTLNSQLNQETQEPIEYDEYRIPQISEILAPVPDQTIDYTKEELADIGKGIETQLANFKVKGKVTGIMTGPVITRFEIEPGPGVKVSRFESLEDDLAMTLKAASVRIISSIPGKSAVGIELPNRKPQTVFCREILESSRFVKDPKKIQVVLGKDVMGDAFVMDLTKTPHLLIAGQTGAGKSVCINVLLASILFSKTPEEVRLILVDPKVVELAMYEKIPHLLHPVITSPEVAVQALKWLCVEMDRRYEVLAKAHVRNIEGFNDKFNASELGEAVPEEERKLMPFIVVVIDELADLMMTAGKEIDTSIARIAQKARAVGIHLVLATQRPSVNVITGVIKANLPSRISFKVASNVDSRTILDSTGAEKLLGRGDMLFRSNDKPEPARVHGAFLKDCEVEALANACSSQNVHYERVESFDLGDAGGDDEVGIGAVKAKDPLFWEAARFGLEVGELSVSALQRRLSVGFPRAGKIADQLTAEGFCSKANGSKPRKMLMDEEMINNLEKSG